MQTMNRRWNHVNRYGYALERALRTAVVTALAGLALLALLRTEWALLPADAREVILCETELSAMAAMETSHYSALTNASREDFSPGHCVKGHGPAAGGTEPIAEGWAPPLIAPLDAWDEL
ncbi:MAG: hypothetical protein HYY02_05800 [Chloroflexi bacterium]|nr:hypothetical protein [Chloroflexota bacterium]